MDDPDAVRRVNGLRDLRDDRCGLVAREWSVLLGVTLEEVAAGPFNREKMQAGARFADLDGSHDVRVHDLLAVLRLAKKTRDGGTVLAKFVAQHLHGNEAVFGVLRPVDGRRAAFAYDVADRVAGQGRADEGVACHAAKLTVAHGGGKRNRASTTPKEQVTARAGHQGIFQGDRMTEDRCC